MLIVDTHCHASPYWFEPIEILLDEMTRNDVDKAVLIQARGFYDNSYLIECKRRFPGRFAVVVVVDTDQPDAPATLQTLEQWVEQGAGGIRLNPMARSQGNDPLAIWRKASELGIAASCLGTSHEFASVEFDNLVSSLPDLSVVIEHLGGAEPGLRAPYNEYRKVLGLAKYPNTTMKVPGLGELCPRPIPFVQPFPFPDVPPLIEMAIDAFGPSRLMWGSDFPPVAQREGYRNSLRFPMEHVPFRSEEDREWVFGKTAASVWKLDEA